MFATGPEGSLFHPRMVRTEGRGPGLPYLKQMRVIHKGQKELSTKGHEVGWICCIGTSRGRQPDVCPPPHFSPRLPARRLRLSLEGQE